MAVGCGASASGLLHGDPQSYRLLAAPVFLL